MSDDFKWLLFFFDFEYIFPSYSQLIFLLEPGKDYFFIFAHWLLPQFSHLHNFSECADVSNLFCKLSSDFLFFCFAYLFFFICSVPFVLCVSTFFFVFHFLCHCCFLFFICLSVLSAAFSFLHYAFIFPCFLCLFFFSCLHFVSLALTNLPLFFLIGLFVS